MFKWAPFFSATSSARTRYALSTEQNHRHFSHIRRMFHSESFYPRTTTFLNRLLLGYFHKSYNLQIKNSVVIYPPYPHLLSTSTFIHHFNSNPLPRVALEACIRLIFILKSLSLTNLPSREGLFAKRVSIRWPLFSSNIELPL